MRTERKVMNENFALVLKVIRRNSELFADKIVCQTHETQ